MAMRYIGKREFFSFVRVRVSLKLFQKKASDVDITLRRYIRGLS